jgi:hypothetical protein
MQVDKTAGGVMIGMIMGFKGGLPLVVFPENPESTAIAARSLTELDSKDIGAQVALLFEDGARDRPLIVGRILYPDPTPPSAIQDGNLVKIEGKDRIELRVGSAAIILEKDGHVTIRGTHLVSHATGSNRIRGGSIDLN